MSLSHLEDIVRLAFRLSCDIFDVPPLFKKLKCSVYMQRILINLKKASVRRQSQDVAASNFYMCELLLNRAQEGSVHLYSILQGTESVFGNICGAQESESTPRNRFREAGNRFMGSLKGLQKRPRSSVSKCRGFGVYSMKKTGPWGGWKMFITREMLQVDLQVLSSTVSAPFSSPFFGVKLL